MKQVQLVHQVPMDKEEKLDNKVLGELQVSLDLQDGQESLDLQDHVVKQVPEVSLVVMVVLGEQERGVNRDHQDQLDLLGKPESLVEEVNQDQEEKVDLQVKQVVKEPADAMGSEVNPDPPALQVIKVLLARMDKVESQDQEEKVDHQGNKEVQDQMVDQALEGNLVHQDPVVNLDPGEKLARLAHQDKEGSQEQMAHEAHLERPGHLDQEGKQDLQVEMVQMVLLDHQEKEENKDHLASQEKGVLLDQEENLAHRDHKVLLEIGVSRDQKVQLALQDLRDQEVNQEQEVNQAPGVKMDLQGLMGHLGKGERMDHQDQVDLQGLGENQVQLAKEVREERLVHEVNQVPQALMGHLDREVKLDLQDHLACLGQEVNLDHKDHQESEVDLDHQEEMVPEVSQGPQVLLALLVNEVSKGHKVQQDH